MYSAWSPPMAPFHSSFISFAVWLLWQIKTATGWYDWPWTADKRQDPRGVTRKTKVKGHAHWSCAKTRKNIGVQIKVFLYLPVTSDMERPLKSSLHLQNALEKLSQAQGTFWEKKGQYCASNQQLCTTSFAPVTLYLADTLKWVWGLRWLSGKIQLKLQRWNVRMIIDLRRWTQTKLSNTTVSNGLSDTSLWTRSVSDDTVAQGDRPYVIGTVKVLWKPQRYSHKWG